MSKRMTDERLAELDSALNAEHGRMFYAAVADELLQALKAERAEVAQYQRSAKRTEEVFAVMKQDLSQSREETRSLHTRLEAAKAKLLAIKELPKLTTRFALGGSTTVVLWEDVEAILAKRKEKGK